MPRMIAENTALINASSEGNTEIVEILIAKGADVNAKDSWGITALIEALTGDLCEERGYIEIAILLIKNGSDVNVVNHRGRTALMIASGKGYTDVVDLLIANGANVNAIDNNGWTALMHATSPILSECVHDVPLINFNAERDSENTAMLPTSDERAY